jgi:uncharacterized protein (TIGR03000 family)
MLRKCFLVPVLASLALLCVVDLAQAQGLRERRMERRDARRGVAYDPNLNQSSQYDPNASLAPTSMMPNAPMGLTPTVQTTTNARISYYPATNLNLNDCCQIRVICDPQAKVYFDGKATTSTGMNRVFDTPALPQGKCTYVIRCTWMENGVEIGRDVTLTCNPNTMCAVDFTAPGRVTVR